MYKIIKKLKLNKSGPNWLEYLFPVLLWGIWMILYSYIDLRSLTIWSTTLLDCLVDGNLYDFYEIVHENIHGTPHQYCGYNYISIIPWAIWNIPIWLIQRFLHIEILENVWLLLWSHLFLVVLFAVIVYISKKIVEIFIDDKERTAWNSYLIFTFPFAFFGVVLAGQSDIIIIFAAVLAVYFLLKDKQWIFIMIMSVAIAAKPFFIFAYIAVILLIEKNLIKILLKAAASMVVTLLFQLIYANAPMYAESYAAGTGNSIIQKTFASGIDANITYQAPLVAIGLVVIYFVAYCISYEQTKEKKYYIIYMMVAPMLVYFAFAHYEFYRMIYLAPFLMILITINSKIYRLNVILETVLSVTGTFLMIYYRWTASVSYFNSSVAKAFGMQRSGVKYDNLYDLLVMKIKDISMYQNVAAGIFVTAIGILLLINIPGVTKRINQPVEKCERYLYWLNTVVLYAMMGILLLCSFNWIP